MNIDQALSVKGALALSDAGVCLGDYMILPVETVKVGEADALPEVVGTCKASASLVTTGQSRAAG